MNKQEFFVLVMDHDRKVMSLHGPLDDDAKINARVVEAKRSGRSITWTTIARPTLASAERDAKALKSSFTIIEDACADS